LSGERPAPRTLLEQLIRQGDATYEETCERYERLARRLGEDSTLSVRHLQRLAYGERSGQRSTPSTRRVMRQLFGYSMQQLLGPPPEPEGSPPHDGHVAVTAPSADGNGAAITGELAERIRASMHLDAGLVQALAHQTDYLREMDRRLPGLVLVRQLDGHVDTIRELLQHSVLSRHRAPLAAELADAEALAAWVALDLGDVDKAWTHHESARLAAREADSPSLLAHAMVQQAFVLTDVNACENAIELVREARASAGSAVPPRLISWLWASEGEVLASAGDDHGSRTAFDRAADVLPSEPADPELPYIQLDRTHLARWHGNALARLGDFSAVDRLYEALDAPDSSLRAQAAMHTDLAYALSTAGNDDEARVQLRRARDLAERAASRRQLGRIRRLATKREYVQEAD
jgi:tetratricopeptide (TPR) repeat protein